MEIFATKSLYSESSSHYERECYSKSKKKARDE